MKNFKKETLRILIGGILILVMIGFLFVKKSTQSNINQESGTISPTSTLQSTTTSIAATTSLNTTSTTSSKSTDKTANWKTYDSGKGFSFRYPTYFSLSSNSTSDHAIFTYDEQGQRFFELVVQSGGVTLEQRTKDIVEKMKASISKSATQRTVTYKPYTVGSVKGYLITAVASDVPKNTDAIFLTAKGEYIYAFSYSYQGYILMKNPAEITGGIDTTKEFKQELQEKLKTYNEIQSSIGSFR